MRKLGLVELGYLVADDDINECILVLKHPKASRQAPKTRCIFEKEIWRFGKPAPDPKRERLDSDRF